MGGCVGVCVCLSVYVLKSECARARVSSETVGEGQYADRWRPNSNINIVSEGVMAAVTRLGPFNLLKF